MHEPLHQLDNVAEDRPLQVSQERRRHSKDAADILARETTARDELASEGLIFLLFDIGLHFSLSHIRTQARDIFGFGLVQVLGGTVGLRLIALAFGLSPVAALLVGATRALSSSAVVAGLVAERHQQNCPVGLIAMPPSFAPTWTRTSARTMRPPSPAGSRS